MLNDIKSIKKCAECGQYSYDEKNNYDIKPLGTVCII